jgi:DNA-binding SARP family transcriptional activator/Tfp pilus assembly protein PilF
VPEAMEFGLLGPLLIRRGGRAVPVPRGRQRDVLAALLLADGQVVSVDHLAEVLWGEQPPPSAEMTVRNYVHRLRQALGDAGRARISTHPHGYLLTVGEDELDVRRFEALLRAALAQARDRHWPAAAGQAAHALALWRGEPLADTESDLLAIREKPRLAELRLQAAETWADALLHLGRHAEVTAELERLTAAYPLRERLHGLLMLARYRAGQPAEALAAYRDARRALVSELGVEPGAELRELHQRILARDPGLARPGPGPVAEGGSGPANAREPAPAVPRELPGAVRGFVGRASEMAALSSLLERAGESAAGTVVISAIGGTAGVGKTALAVQWAHQVAERFQDGQLYVNLHGYDPEQPVTPADALAVLMRSLGVPGPDIPVEAEERSARYRSLLAGRRMLIVLDNAREAAQVRPLLPGSPGCVTLVTSRDSLAGLVARDGAVRLDLDLLPAPEAARLLRALIGERAAEDPDTTRALAEACAYLPLALRVAAELAAARPAVPLADLAAELAGLRRLDRLDGGSDQHTSVRAVFSWSCRHLDAATARTFRLAGLHPGHDFDHYAAAALTGTQPAPAGQALAALARAHLIQPADADRYGIHDLLREYARELAAQDPEPERRAAVSRLLDYYLYTASVAMDVAFPGERHRRPRIPAPASASPPMADEAAAWAWLDAERAGLIAAAGHAADGGWPGHATRLSETLFRYLDTAGHFTEARTLHNHAVRAARSAGDLAAEASALIGVGLSYGQQGRRREAIAHYERALALAREADDKADQARALNYLGTSATGMGRYDVAASRFGKALALFGEAGDQTGAAYALSNLGRVLSLQGNHETAIRHLEQAQAGFRELNDRHAQAAMLYMIGVVRLRQGEYERAAGSFMACLPMYREFGDRMGEADAHVDLGVVRLRQGRGEQAAVHLRHALTCFRELGDQSGAARALNGLGEASLAVGLPADARVHHAAALDLSRQASSRPEQARAHEGLGHAFQAQGDRGQARLHWRHALAIYAELGGPDAERVRALLDAGG